LKTFEDIAFDYFDLFILIGLLIFSYIFTRWIFPKYISYAKKKGWIGKDIHKKMKPEVAESGGIGFIVGIIPSFLIIAVLFPQIRNETLIFLLVVILYGIIGFIDDRIVLSSFKKIFLMLIASSIISILEWYGFIDIGNPIIPILGQLRVTIIYPIIVPIIIVILANLVNMLEGYNGEGSGTALIVIVFLLIDAIIRQSAQGLIFTLGLLGALVAFFKFNKFPAKVFPGDVGTLAMGAAIGCVAIFGSLEVAMFCCILVHLFNGFYVVSSLKGLKESHTITTKDIYVTDGELIAVSKGRSDHMTLPRLLVATKPLSEPVLVHHFWALAYVGGIFSIIAQIIIAFTLNQINLSFAVISVVVILCFIIPPVVKYRAIRGIVHFMVWLLLIGGLLLILIDMYIIQLPFNWLVVGIIAIIGFFFWYYLTIKYFWFKIYKATGEKHEIKLIPFIKDLIKDILNQILARIGLKIKKEEIQSAEDRLEE